MARLVDVRGRGRATNTRLPPSAPEVAGWLWIKLWTPLARLRRIPRGAAGRTLRRCEPPPEHDQRREGTELAPPTDGHVGGAPGDRRSLRRAGHDAGPGPARFRPTSWRETAQEPGRTASRPVGDRASEGRSADPASRWPVVTRASFGSGARLIEQLAQRGFALVLTRPGAQPLGRVAKTLMRSRAARRDRRRRRRPRMPRWVNPRSRDRWRWRSRRETAAVACDHSMSPAGVARASSRRRASVASCSLVELRRRLTNSSAAPGSARHSDEVFIRHLLEGCHDLRGQRGHGGASPMGRL
jgi:hypothetical protein